MAGDWIKMRASLETHPKVIALTKLLESDKAVGKSLAAGFGGSLREIVTRNVTRDVTLASLFRVWCAAIEHTCDGVWYGIELDDLDHVARVPGFGRMLEIIGWAVFDDDSNTVTFPNFLEYNAPAKEGRDKGAAERQRRYREKLRQNSCATGDVTLRATRYGRSDVEKRREEKSNKEKSKPKKTFQKPALQDIELYAAELKLDLDVGQFFDYYESKGWMVGKSPMKDWQATLRNWVRRSKQDQPKSRVFPTEELKKNPNALAEYGYAPAMQEDEPF